MLYFYFDYIHSVVLYNIILLNENRQTQQIMCRKMGLLFISKPYIGHDMLRSQGAIFWWTRSIKSMNEKVQLFYID
jgi:hypothetical protein